MNPSELDRREFHQLTLAALSGVIAGSTIGCGGNATDPSTKPKSHVETTSKSSSPKTLSEAEEALIMDEPHTCRGLNSCKAKGRDKENSCAGQGTCASVANATCGGNNNCKGEGGCGTKPGMNACKGLGGCHIPLMDSAWETARAAFETAMKKHGNTFGPSPAKK